MYMYEYIVYEYVYIHIYIYTYLCLATSPPGARKVAFGTFAALGGPKKVCRFPKSFPNIPRKPIPPKLYCQSLPIRGYAAFSNVQCPYEQEWVGIVPVMNYEPSLRLCHESAIDRNVTSCFLYMNK